MINFQAGYTPANLRLIREEFNLTQSNVADILSVKLRSVQKWEADISVNSHSDMPYFKWLFLINYLGVSGGNVCISP